MRWCAALAAMILLVGGTSCLTAQTSQPYEPTPREVCKLRDARITEASGIVASRRHPGCYYVHNDSGNVPRVFLIDRTGATRVEIRLTGASAVDYEDIAVAPGAQPGTSDVCVADIGDNKARRSRVTIYRFPEVELPTEGATRIDVKPTAYTVSYADGPANAEALCVHPRTGDGYILTKRRDGTSAVYKLAAPWNANEVAVLPKVTTLKIPLALLPGRIVTGADISPDGRRLAVRCYLDGWEWRLPAGTGDVDFEGVFAATPGRLALAAETQGEALCYAADGEALLSVSEGESPALYESRAQPAAEATP